MKNKVIIIGSDHVNTLGLIRMFGEKNIKPYLFLTNSSKHSFVLRSKYIEKYWISDNENISIYKIIEEFGNEKLKPVIIPSSDQAAYLLDMMYSKLCNKFIIPNISNQDNNIIKLMDKYAQYELCKKFNIKMANSITINSDCLIDELKKIELPCIIKPLVSAHGNKDDIVICDSFEELKEAMKNFKEKNYSKVIIQDFIDYDYECDIVGFSFDNKTSISGILKKERIWPLKRGSTTYGIAIPNSRYPKMISSLKKIMSEISYNGIFDIEVFIKGDDFYLNEINFRNSAVSYAYSLNNAPYYWYLSNVTTKFCEIPKIEKEYIFINDIADLHNVLDKNITFKEYKRCKENAKVCLVDNKNDKKPYYYNILKIFLEKVKLNKYINYMNKIFHKDSDEYILVSKYENITKEYYNNDYEIIELNEENYEMICEDENDIKQFGKLIKSRKSIGIALTKENKIICRGFIKFAGAEDRFLNIKNKNSYLLSSVHVNPEFRGKHYQCDLMKELIFRYVKKPNKDTKLFAVVYKYNIPSLKNVKKIGFDVYKSKQIYRFIGKTINKEKV